MKEKARSSKDVSYQELSTMFHGITGGPQPTDSAPRVLRRLAAEAGLGTPFNPPTSADEGLRRGVEKTAGSSDADYLTLSESFHEFINNCPDSTKAAARVLENLATETGLCAEVVPTDPAKAAKFHAQAFAENINDLAVENIRFGDSDDELLCILRDQYETLGLVLQGFAGGIPRRVEGADPLSLLVAAHRRFFDLVDEAALGEVPDESILAVLSEHGAFLNTWRRIFSSSFPGTPKRSCCTRKAGAR